ncbi:MAG TPA: sulfite exporter TauE/SafE family protein [Candidatus Tectomicrobia bacterium]
MRHWRVVIILCAAILLSAMRGASLAHPLGNFTVNHFARIEIGAERVTIHYVLDMAEIPTFQEKQAIDVDGDGLTSTAELNTYLERVAQQYARGIRVDIDGRHLTLEAAAKNLSLPPGAGGLPTLRVECDFTSVITARAIGATQRLRFEDTNHQDRIGWREIVVKPAAGVAIFDSSAFGNGISDELRDYPEDTFVAPLGERIAELSFARGDAPAGAQALRTREGRVTAQAHDRLVELIAVPEVTPTIALLGLLLAAALGSLHALSPGHGKTVVGAYLVGSRGTARHAVFLGLTVTITHTIGVFALGLVTLCASQYIVPERLFPVLSLVSGGIVLAIGLSLFIHRLRAALGGSESDAPRRHAQASNDSQDDHVHHEHAHTYEHAPKGHVHHEHRHADQPHTHHHHAEAAYMHAHGGRAHTHLPPGADGSDVPWRSLLALGISGGLLPCPSALVVLLAAISRHRVGYGLMLVVAFSVGLAATLTAVGFLCVYAGRFMKRSASMGRLAQVLPVISACVIACAGMAICYEALGQAGMHPSMYLARLAGVLSVPTAD